MRAARRRCGGRGRVGDRVGDRVQVLRERVRVEQRAAANRAARAVLGPRDDRGAVAEERDLRQKQH